MTVEDGLKLFWPSIALAIKHDLLKGEMNLATLLKGGMNLATLLKGGMNLATLLKGGMNLATDGC